MTTADLAPLGSQQTSQHPRAGKGELQMQPVETPHDRKVGFRHRARQIVDAATADVQSSRLLGDGQVVWGSIIALRSANRPCRALLPKNRSPASALQSWHAATSRRQLAARLP